MLKRVNWFDPGNEALKLRVGADPAEEIRYKMEVCCGSCVPLDWFEEEPWYEDLMKFISQKDDFDPNLETYMEIYW